MLTIISCFAWLRDVFYKKKLLLLSIMKKQKKGLNYCFFDFTFKDIPLRKAPENKSLFNSLHHRSHRLPQG